GGGGTAGAGEAARCAVIDVMTAVGDGSAAEYTAIPPRGAIGQDTVGHGHGAFAKNSTAAAGAVAGEGAVRHGRRVGVGDGGVAGEGAVHHRQHTREVAVDGAAAASVVAVGDGQAFNRERDARVHREHPNGSAATDGDHAPTKEDR